MNIQYSYINLSTINDFIFDKDNELFCDIAELKSTVINILTSLPGIIIERFEQTHWTIEFTNTKNLEEMYNIDYEIEGITDFEHKIIYIYAKRSYIYSSLLHEIGHFIDWYLGTISLDIRWDNIFNTNRNKILNSNLFPDLSLSNNNISSFECFADIMSIYLSQKNDAIPEKYKIGGVNSSLETWITNLFPYMDRILLSLEYKEPQNTLPFYNYG